MNLANILSGLDRSWKWATDTGEPNTRGAVQVGVLQTAIELAEQAGPIGGGHVILDWVKQRRQERDAA